MFYRSFRRRIRKAIVFIFFVYCVIYLVNSVLKNAGNFFKLPQQPFFYHYLQAIIKSKKYMRNRVFFSYELIS